MGRPPPLHLLPSSSARSERKSLCLSQSGVRCLWSRRSARVESLGVENVLAEGCILQNVPTLEPRLELGSVVVLVQEADGDLPAGPWPSPPPSTQTSLLSPILERKCSTSEFSASSRSRVKTAITVLAGWFSRMNPSGGEVNSGYWSFTSDRLRNTEAVACPPCSDLSWTSGSRE